MARERATKRGGARETPAVVAASGSVASEAERTPPPESPVAVWIARALVVIAPLLAFGRGLAFPLMRSWDDARFLDDPHVATVSAQNLAWMFSAPRFEAYQPLHLLSYWIDVPWLGAEGPAVHATSLALYVLALLAVHALMRRLGLSLVPATIATLLFGLHPALVEAVTWATGRKDVVALGLGALAWSAHLTAPERGPRRVLPAVLFVLAVLAKSAIAPLPFAIAACDVALRGRSWRNALIAQGPTLLAAAIAGVVVISLWDESELIRGGERGNAALVPATIGHLIATAAWPAWLTPMYALARDQALPGWKIALGIAAPIAAIAWSWRNRERTAARYVFGGTLTFLAMAAPVVNLVPLYFQWHDRYVIFPLLGLAIAAGGVLQATLAGGSRVPLAIAGAAVLALGLRTAQYVGTWRDDLALWGHAASVEPRSFYAWLKLGEVRRDAGEWSGALAAYERAIEVAPTLALGYGGAFMTTMRRDERVMSIEEPLGDVAIGRFLGAIEDADALRRLAGDLVDRGYRTAALYAMGRSLDLEPVQDLRLEHAARVQLDHGQEWLARFYVSRMQAPPRDERLRALR